MSYQDKNIPLEKETTGFYGEKEFSLQNDNVHVLTLFLESFRGENVGVLGAKEPLTPCFDALSKEGVLFTNFHSNGTQTFKALFHLLYGLPAYFGSDFQTNGKTLSNVNLRGLPDAFLKKGYEPVFIQGGNNTFDHQGNFLKNQGYKQLYDSEDIKKSNPNAKGSSWGVHDEYLYEHILKILKESKTPLFLNAATITNHHPFRVPSGYNGPIQYESDDSMVQRFHQTMQYSDHALGKFVNDLKTLGCPIHLYIMGDHGVDITDLKSLRQSIKLSVTHIPLLILPITKEPFKGKIISDPASHIDILPTMMDVYGLTGKNSSIGSSLSRKRTSPHALVFNQIAKPYLFGEITKDGIQQNNHQENFNTLEHLFHTKKISSKKGETAKCLDFSSEKITNKELEGILESHKDLYSLILNNCILIHSLDLPFPKTLRKIALNNNLFLTDLDIALLPNTLESLSLVNCPNLTDLSLIALAKLPLKELSLSSENYSQKGLKTLATSLTELKCISFVGGKNINTKFFHNLPNKTLKEVRIKNSTLIDDSFFEEIISHPIEILLLSDGRHITDKGLSLLKDTKLSCLLIENAPQISDVGIIALHKVPFHTFSISQAPKITVNSIERLNSQTLQGIYCVGCGLEEKIEEKEIEGAVRVQFFLDESSLLSSLQTKAFTNEEKNIFFSS